jgi:D-lactate dehydrogenase
MNIKIAFFSSKKYDEEMFNKFKNNYPYELGFFEVHLNTLTVELAKGFQAICAFVNDDLSKDVLKRISDFGIKLILLRCAGYNNVDLKTAKELGITVMRVPDYSPYAVAEHALGMILTLSRKFHKAYYRTREGNFSINGLMGFELHEKIVGIIGTGKIGRITMKVLSGIAKKIIAYDPYPVKDKEGLDFEYVSLDNLYKEADIISLHCPLSPESKHIINSDSISKMKERVVIINTSRGGLIDTEAVIGGLKSGKISALGIDVYEEEGDLFFEDMSDTVIQDDTLMRLMTFPNVLVTGHQAFFTERAMRDIVSSTYENLKSFLEKNPIPKNLVELPAV